MSFIPMPSRRVVPGYGPRNAKIAIFGEAPGAYEDQQLRPFVGPAGSVLEQCLHTAGLIKSEVYLSNIVKVKPPGNDISGFFNTNKGSWTPAGMEWLQATREEINKLDANVLVACGLTAMCALTGHTKIMKYRGYVMESQNLDPPRKVIPCIHPAAALRGMYLYRHLIVADLKKAKVESQHRELKRPERQLIYEFTSVEEVLEWLGYYEKQDRVCFDIEVLNFEISCISFSSNPAVAISVPLAGRWTEQEELVIWRAIQRVLGNPQSIKVVQNGTFDIHFLLTRCGIEVLGPIEDTMVAHSVMYPELRKSLEFQGSIYCGAQEYWKDMIRFDNIKEES